MVYFGDLKVKWHFCHMQTFEEIIQTWLCSNIKDKLNKNDHQEYECVFLLSNMPHNVSLRLSNFISVIYLLKLNQCCSAHVFAPFIVQYGESWVNYRPTWSINFPSIFPIKILKIEILLQNLKTKIYSGFAMYKQLARSRLRSGVP